MWVQYIHLIDVCMSIEQEFEAFSNIVANFGIINIMCAFALVVIMIIISKYSHMKRNMKIVWKYALSVSL